MRERGREREIFKEMGHLIVRTGKSKVHRTDWQARNLGGVDVAVLRQNVKLSINISCYFLFLHLLCLCLPQRPKDLARARTMFYSFLYYHCVACISAK